MRIRFSTDVSSVVLLRLSARRLIARAFGRNLPALNMRKSKISREVSVFQTPASTPYPKAWPLSQKVWSYVRSETTPGGLTSDDAPELGANIPVPGQCSKGKGREADGDRGGGGSNPTGSDNVDEGTEGLSSVDDENDVDNDKNFDNNSNANPDSSSTTADPKSPRRSNRERKERLASPPKSDKPKGPKAKRPRPRKRPREQTDDADGQDEIDDVPAIRQVHAKGIKKRQAIIEESVVKMEGVEVRYTSNPALSCANAHAPSFSPRWHLR